jgi:hypothetical protein
MDTSWYLLPEKYQSGHHIFIFGYFTSHFAIFSHCDHKQSDLESKCRWIIPKIDYWRSIPTGFAFVRRWSWYLHQMWTLLIEKRLQMTPKHDLPFPWKTSRARQNCLLIAYGIVSTSRCTTSSESYHPDVPWDSMNPWLVSAVRKWRFLSAWTPYNFRVIPNLLGEGLLNYIWWYLLVRSHQKLFRLTKIYDLSNACFVWCSSDYKNDTLNEEDEFELGNEDLLRSTCGTRTKRYIYPSRTYSLYIALL